MADSFVHLHNHSEYSMLDGAAKTKAMAEEAARLRQPAIGLTDHGYLFGAFDFYMNCKNAGVKPIIGLEAYVTPGTSRFDRQKVLWGEPWQRADDVSAGGAVNHLPPLQHDGHAQPLPPGVLCVDGRPVRQVASRRQGAAQPVP